MVASGPDLGFAVADNAGDDQIPDRRKTPRVSVRQRVTELAAFVNRAGGLRRHMTRYAARKANCLNSFCIPSAFDSILFG